MVVPLNASLHDAKQHNTQMVRRLNRPPKGVRTWHIPSIQATLLSRF
jgi:hypothetical protein